MSKAFAGSCVDTVLIFQKNHSERAATMPPFCLVQEAWSAPLTTFIIVIPRSFPWDNNKPSRSKTKPVIFSLVQDGGADRPDWGTRLSEFVLIEPQLVRRPCTVYGERHRSSGPVGGSHRATSQVLHTPLRTSLSPNSALTYVHGSRYL